VEVSCETFHVALTEAGNGNVNKGLRSLNAQSEGCISFMIWFWTVRTSSLLYNL